MYFLSCDPEIYSNLFSHRACSATLFKFWLFVLFCISLKRLDKIIFKPHHILNFDDVHDNVWNFHWENFKTSLEYEPAKNLRFNIHHLDVMLIFQINACLTYLHDSTNFIAPFECKALTVFTLKYTNHGGIYGCESIWKN